MNLKRLFSKAPLRAATYQVMPPAAQEGRAGIAIVAIVKDEGPYIQDWLRFHALAGVRDFYIYDNGATDDTIARATSIAGLNVHIIPWILQGQFTNPDVDFSRQILAYGHAVENFGGAYRWMSFIDIDEYLVPKTSLTLDDALRSLAEQTNVSLPWTMYGPNDHAQMPDDATPFAFTTRAATRAAPLLNFKSIVDPCDLSAMRVHRCATRVYGWSSVNDIGTPAHYKARPHMDFLSDANIQLNHYYTRSTGEMHDKLNKGAVSGSGFEKRKGHVLEKLKVIEETAIPDLAAVDFLRRHGIETTEALRALTFEGQP